MRVALRPRSRFAAASSQGVFHAAPGCAHSVHVPDGRVRRGLIGSAEKNSKSMRMNCLPALKYFAHRGSLRGLSVACAEMSPSPAATLTDSADMERPSIAQLRQLGISSSIPFVAFGFFDNAIMILAGDFIDSTLCVTFCFSTMAAAAIGNTISDVFGIFSGGVVEAFFEKNGLKAPPLSEEQSELFITKLYKNGGQALGIIFGCLVGMAPLWFIHPEESLILKNKKHLDEMIDVGIPAIKRLLGAEEVFLLYYDEEKGELSNEYKRTKVKSRLGDLRMRADRGFVGHVATTGHFVNVADVRDEPLYIPEIHDNFAGTGLRFESLLSMPIFMGDKVVAVITAVNKDRDQHGGVFTSKDEDTLSFIASHISVRMGSIDNVDSSFQEVLLSCEQAMNKRESVEWNTSARERRMALYVPALNGIAKLIGAEAVALMLVDDRNEELYTEAIAGGIPKHKTKVGQGIAGTAVKRGEILNADRSEPHWAHLFSERHTDYLGSGIDIRTELCVPLFDSSRKCLGVIQAINKETGGPFDTEDVKDVTRFANNLAIMLEDDGGLKRVLNLTRQRMQQKVARDARDADAAFDQHTILCFLERALNLPDNADPESVPIIDPYITLHIVRGNPLLNQEAGLEERAHKDRLKDKREAERRFGKSKCVSQSLNPHWEETVPVVIPPELVDVPEEELYVHLLLWDRDALKDDDLVAQASFNVAKISRSKALTAKPCRLYPVTGVDKFNLDNSMIWLSFSKVHDPGSQARPSPQPKVNGVVPNGDGAEQNGLAVKQPDARS